MFEIDFAVKDLKLITYFAINKFLIDPLHHQGTSSKRDFIGGFLDRWINRAAEYLFLNYILEEKNREYNVASDFYLYSSDTEKNAPDVLGLVPKGSIDPRIRFSLYQNGTWITREDVPFVEVKTIRPDQNLLAIRDTQMQDDHYYVFIEVDIPNHYLLSIFCDDLFDNEEYLNRITMSEEFIESDKNNQIIQPKLIKNDFKSGIIGKLKLIGIFLGSEFKKFGGYYQEKESFQYIFNIRPHEKKKGSTEVFKFEGNIKIFHYYYKDQKGNIPKYLPIFVAGKCEIQLNLKYKTTAYFTLKTFGKDVWINQFKLSGGWYKIEFKKMERSSNWREYFISKHFFQKREGIKMDYPHIIDDLPYDSTNDLIEKFDNLWESS